MVDQHLTPPMKTIGGTYSCFVLFAILFASIGLIFMLFLSLGILNTLAARWFNSGYWWLFILTPLAFILMVLSVACFIRSREDKNTLLRNMNLFKALKRAEEAYLSDTDIQLIPGEYGSWIEVLYGGFKPDPSNVELGDFERVRREPMTRTPPRRKNSFDISTTLQPNPYIKRQKSYLVSRPPESSYISSIKQERAEVMLDVDRRNHRRQNYDIGISRESSPSPNRGKL